LPVPAADPLLGDLGHGDRGHGPGGDAAVLEGLLQGQRVDHRRQHAHVVAGGPVEAAPAGGHPPEDVAAADHDADVGPQLVDAADLVGDRAHHVEVDAIRALTQQGLAAELEQDAPVLRARGAGRHQ